MKIIKAFFQLIRFPNLIFIALTQILFYYCVIGNYAVPTIHSANLFICLILASVLIAAAGYIINDYFDIQIDATNKPEKVVVDKIIKRRWAMFWHFIFSFSGLVLSFLISYKTGQWVIFFVNGLSVLLLVFYSTHFKKKLLSGNIIISALTAWVIIVVFFFAGAELFSIKGWEQSSFQYDIKQVFKLTMLYAGFAFVVSLIREAVKDMEDMYGDARFQCKTMPIVWGIPVSKMYAGVWAIVSFSGILILQLYAWQMGWRWSVLYSLILIAIPFLVFLKKLYHARVAKDYHTLSNLLKLIMLTGILSMLFFKF